MVDCREKCKGKGRRRFTDRITVERLKTAAEGATVDAANVIDPTVDANWTTHCSRFAEVTETGGNERVNGRQVKATTTHLIVMRSDPTTRTITQRMQVVLGSWWGSVTLQIEGRSINRQEVTLQCETRQ